MVTKKAVSKDKGLPANTQNKKDIAATKNPTTTSPSSRPTVDPAAQAQALQAYEQALKAMQIQKFDKAKPLFERVIATGTRELADRAKVHLSICEQQLSRTQTKFASVEEQFDFAISLMNMGDYVTAREHLENMSNQNPKLDFVWYGFAALECLTGHTNESLQHLAEAIRLNPHVRYQARNDSDFRNMADDPRFTELLYPEGASL